MAYTMLQFIGENGIIGVATIVYEDIEGELRNVYYCYLRYEKLGLFIRFVLHGEKIHGFWLNYYEV